MYNRNYIFVGIYSDTTPGDISLLQINVINPKQLSSVFFSQFQNQSQDIQLIYFEFCKENVPRGRWMVKGFESNEE